MAIQIKAKPGRKLVFLFILFFSGIQVSLAELILSAPPREDAQTGEEQYGPIALYLGKILGEEVVYKHPSGWSDYADDMRAGKYDIVFDEPHYAAWRMAHVQHVPTVRLKGTLDFVVVSKSEDKKIKSMRSLLGKPICGLASPDLGTVTAFALYNNPVIHPEIRTVNGNMGDVIQAFLNGTESCRAAVVSDVIYNLLPQDQKNRLKVIATSTPVPNQTITVSARIKKIDREKIEQALISNEGAAAAEQLLKRFSNADKHFIPAKSEEYKGLETLLEGVVYGW